MKQIISTKCGLLIAALGVLLPSACSGDGEEENEDASALGNGTITDTWRSYCIATFTEEYVVNDAFDEPQFTAHVGDEYLLSYYGEGIGDDRGTLVYLSSAGPSEYDVSVPVGTPFPFTTQCALNNTVPYYGVFTDVSLFAAADLATKICDLSAGSVVPLDSTSSGFSSTTLDFSGPETYEIFLNAFSAQCGGAASGFVSVPQTQLFGTTTWLVPIIKIVGPT
jgi:hypothetical protein